MIRTFLIVALFILRLESSGQADSLHTKELYVGMGIGLDHGGIGLRLDGRVIPAISVIMGAGFNFAGVGWNVGVVYRIRPRSNVCPYLTGLYGYNTAIRYENSSGYVAGENYNGPTFGAGLEFKLPNNSSFFHFAVLFPIRNEEAEQAIIRSRGMNLPLLPSLGFHF